MYCLSDCCLCGKAFSAGTVGGRSSAPGQKTCKAACKSLDTEVLWRRKKENKQAGLNSESSLGAHRWLAGLLAKLVLKTVQLLEAVLGLRWCQMVHAVPWANTEQFLSNIMRSEFFSTSPKHQIKNQYLS